MTETQMLLLELGLAVALIVFLTMVGRRKWGTPDKRVERALAEIEARASLPFRALTLRRTNGRAHA